MNFFNNVKSLSPKRSKFNLSHTVDFDCKIGEIIPFLIEEMVPGDVFKISNIHKIHFQPLVAPISDYLEVKMDYFFSPHRLTFNEILDGVGNSWESFITQVPTDNSQGIPTFAVQKPKWNPSNNGVHSLWDYCGLPVGVSPRGKSAPDALIKRGYNLIFNEFLRDENLQEEIDIKTNEEILFSNVSKDYFTSAFTERQRGPTAGLPVSSVILGNGLLPFSYRSNGGMIGSSEYLNFQSNIHVETGVPNGINFMQFEDNNSVIQTGRKFDQGNASPTDYTTVQDKVSLYVNSSDVANRLTVQSSTVTISDLRLAYQIQKWQERSLIGGKRYTEFLHSFFGVSPRDDRLQRPEYVGGTRSPVVVTDIVQQSQTTDSSAQGTESGHMISTDANKVSTYRAVEFGYLFGLMRIVPKIKYTNGIPRQYLRNTPFDYYFPTFAHLSEQGIYNCEVFAQESEEENMKIWGYQGIYNEMRYKPSRVCGALRQSDNGFLFWTMARKFTSLPNLNENFISTKFMQQDFMRIFQIKNENLTRPCIVHIYNNITAYRPMPFLPTPQ